MVYVHCGSHTYCPHIPRASHPFLEAYRRRIASKEAERAAPLREDRLEGRQSGRPAGKARWAQALAAPLAAGLHVGTYIQTCERTGRGERERDR